MILLWWDLADIYINQKYCYSGSHKDGVCQNPVLSSVSSLNEYLIYPRSAISRKLIIIEETKKLFEKDESSLLTGRGKTKADIGERIKMFDDMLSQLIGE